MSFVTRPACVCILTLPIISFLTWSVNLFCLDLWGVMVVMIVVLGIVLGIVCTVSHSRKRTYLGGKEM